MSIFNDRYKQMGETIKFITPRRAIRVNTNKISAEKLKERLEKRKIELEPIPFVKNGFYVRSKFNIVSTPEYLLGLFYIQDAAAQLPVEVLKPKGLSLDCCAAPGGKTTQLSEYGNVIAIESNPERLAALENNLERLGVKNAIVYQMDVRQVNKEFDYILLDAPCSGNYILEEGWMQKNTVKRVEERARLQKELIGHTIALLKKGGVLVYSTCSLEPEEDEFVIQYALENFDVKLERVETIGDPGLTEIFGTKLDPTMKYTRRLWPHKTNTIGFFIARFRKC